MGNEQRFFIVPVTSGLCIEPNRNFLGQPYTRIPNQQNLNQQWYLQWQGNQVAFRNVGGGDYMHANGNHNEALIKMDNTPHWWSLEPGQTAGSFWIHSEDMGGYLCNPYARHTEDNMQWMWSWKEPQYTQLLLFYLQSVQSLYGGPAQVLYPAGGTSQEVQERERAWNAKQNEIAAKEKDLAQQHNYLASQQQAAAEKQKQFDQLTTQQQEFGRKQKEFQAQQQAAAEKQSKLEEREKMIAAKEAGSAKGSKGAKDAESQVAQLQSQLAESNKALEAARNREAASSSQAEGDSTQKKEELRRARERIAALEAQVRDNEAAARGTNGTRPMGRLEGGDPTSDNRWRSDAPLTAAMRPRANDSSWRADAPRAAALQRKAPPSRTTDGDAGNDSRWRADGQRTTADGKLAPIVIQREFTMLSRFA